MQLKFRGAVTFHTDESLENAMQAVRSKIDSNDASFLTMDHIDPLGLHVTVHHSGNATPEQVEESRAILKKLAASAYSGYVDLWIDNAQEAERYHAKEIAPKELSVDDIATT